MEIFESDLSSEKTSSPSSFSSEKIEKNSESKINEKQ
jgi:hypothetical protein